MALSEFDIIARYFTRASARDDVLLGIGDDAAVLAVPPDRRLVTAVDTLVEGVHFPVGTDAADIGYRALAVNLSDIAAMGAEPAWMTLSLSLARADERWLEGFAAGLFDLAALHSVALVGGDTVRGPLVITVQLSGVVEPERWLTRSGARPGDLLFVSGVPGEAAAGLALWDTAGDDAATLHLRRRFLRPEPRVALGRQLRSLASAAMDVSDGLLADLTKLCTASGCGARVDIDALPVSLEMRQRFNVERCVEYALAGGDDYEIIFTVPSARKDELAAIVGQGQTVTQIGEITGSGDVRCMRGGKPFAFQRGGYDHFVQDPGS